jgi:hypothetical protein
MFRLYVTGPDTDGTARFLDSLIPLLDYVPSAARRLDSHVIVSDGAASPMAAANCCAEGRKR